MAKYKFFIIMETNIKDKSRTEAGMDMVNYILMMKTLTFTKGSLRIIYMMGKEL
jgi:hypothetical protein